MTGETGRTDQANMGTPRQSRLRLLWRQANSLSLRARLVGAFTVLIVSSASATIGIGNMVFGDKLVELARARVETGVNVARLALSIWQDRMRQRARIGARLLDLGERPALLCRTILDKPGLLDFALVAGPDGGFTLLLPGSSPRARPPLFGDDLTSTAGDGSLVQEECAVQPLTGNGIAGSQLEELGQDLAAGGGRCGLLVVPASVTGWLQHPNRAEPALMMAAAAAAADGSLLLLGTVLNGRSDFASAPLEVLSGSVEARFSAALFLGGLAIASSGGPGELPFTVPEALATQPASLAGEARMVSSDSGDHHVAFLGLKDYRDETVGVLGVGLPEELYLDVRNRTVTLFSSLIVAGMVFGFLMTYFFSAWLIKPVAALAEGMHRVAEGDLTYKVRFHATDELGSLVKAFNKMVRTVKERDIRLREMTEERLSHVEKQVSVGRLAAGVAHEINNPLTSVLSLSALMLRHLPADDSRREDLEIIVEETTRCRDIVRNLLDFARERPSEKQRVDLNQIIRDTLSLSRRYEGMEKVVIEARLSHEPLVVVADPKQLQQVFTNLLTNAADGCSQKGSVTVSSDEDSSGAYAVVQVKDSGSGIPKSCLGRVFEPFFTTKGKSRGTGLGLSVSLGIVRKHSGTIDLESREGEGTCVTVSLPLAREDHGRQQ